MVVGNGIIPFFEGITSLNNLITTINVSVAKEDPQCIGEQSFGLYNIRIDLIVFELCVMEKKEPEQN